MRQDLIRQMTRYYSPKWYEVWYDDMTMPKGWKENPEQKRIEEAPREQWAQQQQKGKVKEIKKGLVIA